METSEIIKKVQAIRSDVLNEKINFDEAMINLHLLSREVNVNFNALYNAFYSSQPHIYFN